MEDVEVLRGTTHKQRVKNVAKNLGITYNLADTVIQSYLSDCVDSLGDVNEGGESVSIYCTVTLSVKDRKLRVRAADTLKERLRNSGVID